MFNPKEKANKILDNLIMSEIVEPKLETEEDIDYVWENLVMGGYEIYADLCYLVGIDYIADYFNKAVDSLAKETL
tara:strand:+ start:2032 stop:2256 length:225 start_codon:yes stop_codon:yes gene_type:complete